jgi:hypothetical protein
MNRKHVLFITFTGMSLGSEVLNRTTGLLNRLSTGCEHLSGLIVRFLTITIFEIWVIAWDISPILPKLILGEGSRRIRCSICVNQKSQLVAGSFDWK